MKAPTRPVSRIGGTILIFSLVVILGGALVLAAWAQKMATATLYPDTTFEAVKDRIAMENARALARQYLLASLPNGGTISTNYWVDSISNGIWGGCTVPPSIAAPHFWTNTNYIPANPFSPFGNRCFAVTNFPILSNVSHSLTSPHSLTSRFLIKSRSPIIAGYPLVVHQTSPTNLSGAWTNTNRIYYTNVIGFPGFPNVPFTSGTNADTGPNGFLGYFAAPISSSYTNVTGFYTNLSYRTNAELIYTNVTGGTATTNTFTKDGIVYTNYTGGNLTALLNPTNQIPIVRYEVPPTTAAAPYLDTNTFRRYTNASITNLFIFGSTTQTNVMHIVQPSTVTNLSTLTLTNTANTRKIYLNKQSSGNMTIATATTKVTYNWWFAATTLPTNSLLTVRAPTKSGCYLNLTGGIRSSQTLTNTGNLRLYAVPPATSTMQDNIELLSDRLIWLEGGGINR